MTPYDTDYIAPKRVRAFLLKVGFPEYCAPSVWRVPVMMYYMLRVCKVVLLAG